MALADVALSSRVGLTDADGLKFMNPSMGGGGGMLPGAAATDWRASLSCLESRDNRAGFGATFGLTLLREFLFTCSETSLTAASETPEARAILCVTEALRLATLVLLPLLLGTRSLAAC